MSTKKKNNTITTQLQRPPEYYKKLKAELGYSEDVSICPPSTLRIIPYRPGRGRSMPYDPYVYHNNESDDEEDDDATDVDVSDDEPPRLDGKSKSLLKRLNKSGNSVFSKKWTRDRNKARQVVRLHRLEPVLA